MEFSSVTFLFVFFPIILIAYYSVPKYLKNTVLLIGSLLFYSLGKPIYLLIIILAICIAYLQGLIIRKYNKINRKKKSRNTLIFGIIINCTMLIVFRYFIPLPFGMTIFTMQIMSYLIDVYRGEGKAKENPLDLALYISMFTQIVAGPVLKYQIMENQINYRDESVEKFAIGARKFIIGLAKKMIFANTMLDLFNQLKDLKTYDNSVVLSWICGITYMLYVYYNFSGYTDLATGLANMFSFEYPANFNYPYISRSITEFWQRWNVLLVSWFKEYVFNPLGGNKNKKIRIIVSTLITWILIGMWHGTTINFLLWGLFYAIIIIFERLFVGRILEKLPKIIGKIYTLFLINIGWVIFAYDDMGQMLNTFKNMFFANGLPIWNSLTTYYLISYGVIFIILIISSTPYITVFVTTFMKTLSKSNKRFEVFGCVVEPLYFLLLLVMSVSFMVSR